VNRAVRHHAQQMAESMPLPLSMLARRLNRIQPVTGGEANGHGTSHADPATGSEGAFAQGGLQLPAEMIEKMPQLVGENGVIPD